jgi:hypothetical protein
LGSEVEEVNITPAVLEQLDAPTLGVLATLRRRLQTSTNAAAALGAIAAGAIAGRFDVGPYALLALAVGVGVLVAGGATALSRSLLRRSANKLLVGPDAYRLFLRLTAGPHPDGDMQLELHAHDAGALLRARLERLAERQR